MILLTSSDLYISLFEFDVIRHKNTTHLLHECNPKAFSFAYLPKENPGKHKHTVVSKEEFSICLFSSENN